MFGNESDWNGFILEGMPWNGLVPAASVKSLDGNVAIPNGISVILKTKVPFVVSPEFLPGFKFTAVYFFIPDWPSKFSFNDFFSIEPVLNRVPV